METKKGVGVGGAALRAREGALLLLLLLGARGGRVQIAWRRRSTHKKKANERGGEHGGVRARTGARARAATPGKGFF